DSDTNRIASSYSLGGVELPSTAFEDFNKSADYRGCRRGSHSSFRQPGRGLGTAPGIQIHMHLFGRLHLAAAGQRAAVQGDGLAVDDVGLVAFDDQLDARVPAAGRAIIDAGDADAVDV